MKRLPLILGGFELDACDANGGAVPRSYSAVELNLNSVLTWSSREIAAAKKRIGSRPIVLRLSLRPSFEKLEWEERLQVWSEKSSAFTRDPNLEHVVLASGGSAWNPVLHSQWLSQLPGHLRYWCEWGKNDDAASVKFLESFSKINGFVVDPLWHARQKAKRGGLPVRFRLHGWHESRWVRRYGSIQMNEVIRRCQDAGESSSLTLHYSGKWEQAELFEMLFEKEFNEND